VTPGGPAPSAAAPPGRPHWTEWLPAELAPAPGRWHDTVCVVIATTIVLVTSMTLEVPILSLSLFIALFILKAAGSDAQGGMDVRRVAIAGVMVVTLALVLTMLILRLTMDAPPLRVAAMAASFFLGMWFSRVFKVRTLGYLVGLIVLVSQAYVDVFPGPEAAVRTVLWIWVAVAYPALVAVGVKLLLAPSAKEGGEGEGGESDRADKAPKKESAQTGPWVPDAWTNPAYVQFAVKATIAAMLCYVFYTAVDWPGIHTIMITCAVVALGSTEATLHKSRLRLAGCAVGGALALGVIVFVFPRLESIGSLAVVVAVVTAPAAWIALGSERLAYLGVQMAFTFYIATLQGFAPDFDVTGFRDRFVGIVLGVLVMGLVFTFVWPERAVTEVAP
jgi:hypothetical protein